MDGQFDWVTQDWGLRPEYGPESLITQVSASNKRLVVTLQCQDLVDYRENIYIKKVSLKNLSARNREFRLFFHHDYHILGTPIGDTADYDPMRRLSSTTRKIAIS